MPRRKQRRQRRNSSRPQTGGIVTVTVRSLGTSTLAGGLSTQTMSPNGFSVAASMADIYEMYRLVALKYRIHPATTITATQGMCYIPGVVDTSSAFTTSVISQCDNNAILGVRQTTPTQWVKVSRKKLNSYMTWYKTVVGSPDTDVETQGVLYLAGTGTEVLTYEVQAVFQFKSLVPSGATPKMRAQQALLVEKDRLLRILSYSPTANGRQEAIALPKPSTNGVPVAM